VEGGSSPNRVVCILLAGVALAEQHDGWFEGRRDFGVDVTVQSWCTTSPGWTCWWRPVRVAVSDVRFP